MAIIILDPGHGSIDVQRNKVNSPSYMYNRKETVYEGYYNRLIAIRVKSILDTIEGIKTISTVDLNGFKDLQLDKRVAKVNNHNKKTTILLSFHSSKSEDHLSRGLELWTSIGRSRSSKLAKDVAVEMMDNLKRFGTTFRFDYVHNMYNQDDMFYVLRNTKCPSIVFNNLFYDNAEDLELLKNEDFLDELAVSIVEGTMEFINKTIKKIDEI